MIRLGVIGCGGRAHMVLRQLAELEPGRRSVVVVDPRGPAALEGLDDHFASVALAPDVPALLSDGSLDGVIIASPNVNHVADALQVIDRKVPLFLEKPACVDWEQYAALEAASSRVAAPVVVSFPLRMAPISVRVGELLADGCIGDVAHVQAVQNVPAYGVVAFYHGWRRDESLSGGLWLEKATHDFDYLTWLIGQAPVEIMAMESKTVFRGDMPAGLRCVDCDQNETCLESPRVLARLGDRKWRIPDEEWRCVFGVDTGNHDSATAMVRYQSGLHLVYSQNFYSRRRAAARGARFIGHKGTLHFDFHSKVVTVIDHFSDRVVSYDVAARGSHYGGDRPLLKEFLSAIRGGDGQWPTLDDGLRSAKMGLLARDACAQGKQLCV